MKGGIFLGSGALFLGFNGCIATGVSGFPFGVLGLRF